MRGPTSATNAYLRRLEARAECAEEEVARLRDALAEALEYLRGTLEACYALGAGDVLADPPLGVEDFLRAALSPDEGTEQ